MANGAGRGKIVRTPLMMRMWHDGGRPIRCAFRRSPPLTGRCSSALHVLPVAKYAIVCRERARNR